MGDQRGLWVPYGSAEPVQDGVCSATLQKVVLTCGRQQPRARCHTGTPTLGIFENVANTPALALLQSLTRLVVRRLGPFETQSETHQPICYEPAN